MNAILQEFLPLLKYMESMHILLAVLGLGILYFGWKVYEKYKDVELEKTKRERK